MQMKSNGKFSLTLAAVETLLAVAFASIAQAQEPVPAAQVISTAKTGAPCTPRATITVDGKHLPPAPASFGGEINLSAEQSKPCWPPTVAPPKGAPNVLLI